MDVLQPDALHKVFREVVNFFDVSNYVEKIKIVDDFFSLLSRYDSGGGVYFF